jgi:hypothetical protein
LTHRLGWATIGWRETSNDVENLHRSQKQNNPSVSKEFAARTHERGGTGRDGHIVRRRQKGESVHRLFIWTEESFFQNVNAVVTLQSALRGTPPLAGRAADAGFSSMFRL